VQVAAAGGFGDIPMDAATVSSATAPLDAAVRYIAFYDRALSGAEVSTVSARFLQGFPRKLPMAQILSVL